MTIKRINTGGISYLAPLTGSREWYWGTDYTSGDLYEAEELFRDGHRIRQNRLIFVHYPDGRVVEPVQAREGQYFGRPAWDGGVVILLADFPAETLDNVDCRVVGITYMGQDEWQVREHYAFSAADGTLVKLY